MYNLFIVTGFTYLTDCMLLLRMKPCVFPKTISETLIPICIRIEYTFNILSVCEDLTPYGEITLIFVAFTASLFTVMQ
jgi:hypothetical protein